MKAIRLKCLDCCCGSSYEVKLCTVAGCPLYPFREGHNPFTKREYTPEQKAAMAARLTKNKRTNMDTKSEN